MRSVGYLFVVFSLLTVPALFACGGETEAASPPETTTIGSTAPAAAPAADRPAVVVDAPRPPGVTVTVPTPPSVTVTAPTPGSVEVN